MQHDASERLQGFIDGETRLIYAARRDPAITDLYLLEDDTATESRAYTKTSLRCFVPDCPTPDFTTVHRSKDRDGFRHLSGGTDGHAPESTFHIQGKQVVADWLRRKYPEAQVFIEQASDTQRSRVADVMVTVPTGERIAIEVQYASLTVEAWQERHESYRTQGITDIWLFGHFGAQLKLDRAGQVFISALHQAVVLAGLPLLWYNPITEQIATATSRLYVGPGTVDVFAGLSEGGVHAFNIEHLNAAYVHKESGIATDYIAAAQINTASILDRRAHDTAEAQARQEARERNDAAARAENEARKETARTLEPGWRASLTCKKAESEFGGVWPSWLSVATYPTLPLPSAQWQFHLWKKFIAGKPSGQRIDLPELIAHLRDAATYRNVTDDQLAQAITMWLTAVAKDTGQVKYVLPAKFYRRPQPSPYWVVLDVEGERKRAADREEHQRRAAEARALRAMLIALRQEELAKPIPPRQAPASSITRPATLQLRCTRCGLGLDPILAAQGRHISC